MDSFSALGADEAPQPTAGDKALEWFKEAAPSLVTATTKAIQGKPASPPLQPPPSQTSSAMPTWVWPVVGVGAAGVLGFIVYSAVKK